MADIQSEGALIAGVDLTDEASTAAAIERILAEQGRVDALINNAGYGSHGPIETVPLDEARRQFEVNVFAVARLIQLVLPSMRAAKSGTIVNIGSIAGRMWMPFGAWYHATKYSIEAMTDALRLEVEPFGVRAVLIQPGAIKTEWGGIAQNNLIERSRGTVYERAATNFSKILPGAGMAVGPERVANVVSRAVNSRRPCFRYATPFHARLLILMSWLMPTRVWHFAMRRMLVLGLAALGTLAVSQGASAQGKGAKAAPASTEMWTRARTLAKNACSSNVYTSCHRLGTMFENGESGARDPALARQYYDLGCKGNHLPSCSSLAQMVGMGVGGPEDLAYTRKLFEKVCAGNDATGCNHAATMFTRGHGGPVDDKKALEMFRKSCVLNNAEGCGSLGLMFETGRGTSKDMTEARRLYKKGCDGGFDFGCLRLATFMGAGIGGTKDLPTARTMLVKLCDLNNAEACLDMGLMYERGMGGPADAEASKKCYRKACDAGQKKACDALQAK
jgi:NAD(P)-dependent dehydrogenase (short-subunit alcohol dehydrogenase family)/TPR repeat protein